MQQNYSKKSIKLYWHRGVAYGMLNAISHRPDIPNDVREVCRDAYEKYKEEFSRKDKK